MSPTRPILDWVLNFYRADSLATSLATAEFLKDPVAVPVLNSGPIGITQVDSPLMQEIRWNMLGAKRNAAQLRVL